MRDDVRRDYQRQRPYVPAMAQIAGDALAPYLFIEAPAHEDMCENSDLVILRARDLRVACRVRSAEYLDSYPFDVTFRAHRASGSATELQKLMAGYGDAFIYGIAAPTLAPKLLVWSVLSLKRFRAFFRDCDHSCPWTGERLVTEARRRGLRRCGVKLNHDRITSFVHFDVRELGTLIPDVVVDRCWWQKKAATQ